MITTPEEYQSLLYEIQNKNFPTTAILLPSTEKIYNIDLDTRTIEAPEILSAETDHYAETIYFKVDRYFDNMDLTNTVCVVQYINENAINPDTGAAAGGFAYAVPFYDITKFADENKILFPWCISGAATAAAGPVTFAIRFYKLNEEGTKFLYNLNTIEATSQVLHGINVSVADNSENFEQVASMYEDILDRINKVTEMADLYWISV